MIKREDCVIVYLSLVILATQMFWMKAERQAAYYHGKLDGLTVQMVDDDGQGVHKTVPKRERW